MRAGVSKTVLVALVILILVVVAAAAVLMRPAQPTTQPTPTQPTQPAAPQKKVKVAVIFDIGGRGDLSFNDMAWMGAERAKKDFGVEVTYVQSRTSADYLPNLRSLSQSKEYDLIICVGFLMTDALNQTAHEFPNQKYAIIDSVVNAPNVRGIIFKENEGSALVGALAGFATKTNKVGVVLGIEIPVLYHFEAGFYWGVNYAENITGKKVQIIYKYTGSFTDAALGKQVAEGMLTQGADVLYNVAGLTGKGMLDAVADYGAAHGLTMGPPFGIGVDADQDWIHPGFVIASMMKRVDNGVYYAIRDVVYGNFTGGVMPLGLKEGGVKMSDENDLVAFIEVAKMLGAKLPDTPENIIAKYKQMRSQIPQSVWDQLKTLEEKIKKGEIVIPTANSPDEIKQIRARYGVTG
jgi:basic membrane protein A